MKHPFELNPIKRPFQEIAKPKIYLKLCHITQQLASIRNTDNDKTCSVSMLVLQTKLGLPYQPARLFLDLFSLKSFKVSETSVDKNQLPETKTESCGILFRVNNRITDVKMRKKLSKKKDTYCGRTP